MLRFKEGGSALYVPTPRKLGGFIFEEVFDVEGLDEDDEACDEGGGDDDSKESDDISKDNLREENENGRKGNHFALGVGGNYETFQHLYENKKDDGV